MHFLDTLILPIFATAFSFLGQASQIAEKCLQGCQSKALLSPENIDCPIDEISPCFCASTPLRDVNFCCLVTNCLLAPDEALYQWTLACAAAQISVPMPKYSKEIPCSAFGKISSSTLYLSRSRDVKYIGPPDIIGWKVISFVTDGVVTTYSVTAPATTNSQVMVSSGGSTTFDNKPSTNISTLPPPSPTPAIPAIAPQNTSSNNLGKTTTGDSHAKDKKKKLGIILGLSIPATIVLVLAAIFFWIRRLKSKQRATELSDRDEAKGSRGSKEGLSDIPEEEGGGGGGGGGGGSEYGNNKEKATRLSELHSDPIPPYSTELPGTPAPQLIELPG